MATRPFLQHHSVRALLEADGTTDVPDLAIQRMAQAWVAKCSLLGWDGPPFDMELMASLRGYEVMYTRALADDQSGCILAGSRRILINVRLPRRRQRYTIAHEIAHTFFPDFGSAPAHEAPHIEYDFSEQSPVEQLCQIAAAELLMPLDSFRAARIGTLALAAPIKRLAEMFDASFEAIARRWVSLSPPTATLIHARPADGGLVVGGSIRGGELVPPLRRGTRLPDETLPVRLWKRARRINVPLPPEGIGEYWHGFGGVQRCFVEATPLPLEWAPPTSILCITHRI